MRVPLLREERRRRGGRHVVGSVAIAAAALATAHAATDWGVVCTHGVNMFCVNSDESDVAYFHYSYDPAPLSSGHCEDSGSVLQSPAGFPGVSIQKIAYGYDCAQCGARCCNVANGCASADSGDVSCECFGHVPPTSSSELVLAPTSGILGSPQVSIYSSISHPPSPPFQPCSANLYDSSSISHCFSDSTKSGSSCENMYDGVVGGYNSIGAMGGDLARSWVANDVSNAAATFVFKQPIDINTIFLAQRLYHGLNNQVTSIAIVVFDAAGNQMESVSGVVAPIATAPMKPLTSFVSKIALPRTYGNVKSLKIIIDGAQDSGDVGIEELSFGHICNTPPSPHSPPPSPPGLPPSPPLVITTAGSITGDMITATWFGNAQPVLVTHTAEECSIHCGSFYDAEEFSFYQSNTTLPVATAACECYQTNKWTVLDGREASGFVHGKAFGSKTLFAGNTLFVRTSGFSQVADGLVVPFNTHLAASSSFKLTFTMQVKNSIRDTLGNVMRVAPWSSKSECRPCVDISKSQIRLVYYTGKASTTWYKSAIISFSMTPMSAYTIVAELSERRLFLNVYDGAVVSASSHVAEKSTGLSLAGEFPPYERVVVYMGSTGAGNIDLAFAKVDPESVIFEDTLSSHKHFQFSFDDTDFLRNSATFAIGFNGPSLVQANTNQIYATASPNTVVKTTGRSATNYAAAFDKQSMLILETENTLFDPAGGLTVCLWMKPTVARDTLFTTLASYGSSFAVHYFAYFGDISVMVSNEDTRGAPSTAGLAANDAWSHFCGSFAVGGTTRLYKYGQLIGVGVNDVQLPLSWNAPFSIGASTDIVSQNVTGNDRGFGGLIDDVLVFGRQLSDAEVLKVFSL